MVEGAEKMKESEIEKSVTASSQRGRVNRREREREEKGGVQREVEDRLLNAFSLMLFSLSLCLPIYAYLAFLPLQ